MTQQQHTGSQQASRPQSATPPAELVHLAHGLYAAMLYAFAPLHLGGPDWVLISEDDADVVMVLSDTAASSYTPSGWDHGTAPLIAYAVNYDADDAAGRLTAALHAVAALRTFHQAARRFAHDIHDAEGQD